MSSNSTTLTDAANLHNHEQVLVPKRVGRYQWRLRGDEKRSVLFRIDEECRIISREGLLHPSEDPSRVLWKLADGVTGC
jgi:hypothetical protein